MNGRALPDGLPVKCSWGRSSGNGSATTGGIASGLISSNGIAGVVTPPTDLLTQLANVCQKQQQHQHQQLLVAQQLAQFAAATNPHPTTIYGQAAAAHQLAAVQQQQQMAATAASYAALFPTSGSNQLAAAVASLNSSRSLWQA